MERARFGAAGICEPARDKPGPCPGVTAPGLRVQGGATHCTGPREAVERHGFGIGTGTGHGDGTRGRDTAGASRPRGTVTHAAPQGTKTRLVAGAGLGPCCRKAPGPDKGPVCGSGDPARTLPGPATASTCQHPRGWEGT